VKTLPIKAPKTTLEVARHLCRIGCAVIPIPAGEKNPNRKGWQNERLTEDDLPRHFTGNVNIGILTGAPSRGLVDVDLDAPEAVAARELLGLSPMIHGRPGKPFSHYWYLPACGLKTTKFQFTEVGEAKPTMLVELRSTGCQTVVPPSVHPSGERLGWERFPDIPGL
jgi:putative DNA primase/helicase